MIGSFMKIDSCMAQGYQKEFADSNGNFPKESGRFGNSIGRQKKINFLNNEPAIKYSEAGSIEREKDVLVEEFASVALGSSLKTTNDSRQPKTIIYFIEII